MLKLDVLSFTVNRFPTYYNEHVLRVLAYGIRWLKPTVNMPYPKTNVPVSLEPITPKDFSFSKVGIVKG